MVVSLAVVVGVSLGFPGACKYVIPSDNSLDDFRQDPGRWLEKATHLPKPNASNLLQYSDGLLYGADVAAAEGWWDYLYPSVSEKTFDGPSATQTLRGWWWLSYVIVTIYLSGLWIGSEIMRPKAPYNLRVPLAVWNGVLALFSIIGTLRVLPHLIMLLRNYGLEYTLCRRAVFSYGSGAAGLWVCVFILSKFFELVDTAFLVLRKRRVGFLHWYHHCSVLLYCWHAYMWEMPTGIYFVAMNYTVHAIMYSYYFLAAVCERPPRWGLFVTVLQLAQMAVGIFITLSHMRLLLYKNVPGCDGHVPNLLGALAMYASYFILFAQFLGNRYCARRDRTLKCGKTL